MRIAESKRKAIIECFHRGMSIETIAELTDMSILTIQRVIKIHNNKTTYRELLLGTNLSRSPSLPANEKFARKGGHTCPE